MAQCLLTEKQWLLLVDCIIISRATASDHVWVMASGVGSFPNVLVWKYCAIFSIYNWQNLLLSSSFSLAFHSTNINITIFMTTVIVNKHHLLHRHRYFSPFLLSRAKWPMKRALISRFCSVKRVRVFDSPGRDTNPSQVSSQQKLVLIYLPRKDGKLSWLRRERKSYKSVQILAVPGI